VGHFPSNRRLALAEGLDDDLTFGIGRHWTLPAKLVLEPLGRALHREPGKVSDESSSRCSTTHADATIEK
jgi:hypothetical protein